MLDIPKYIEFEELLQTIRRYNPRSDFTLIAKAFEYAKEKHGTQIRKSGHPYYTHPLAVANVVAILKLDDTSIITALLHDVIEDTDVTFEDIAGIFGMEIAKIVDGVTKLGSIEYKNDEIKEAENLRKLFLALSQDIRVLIVKLCDRLHNMMTMDSILSYKKRRAKAIETLEVYAPLAERIGMYQMKDTLQDLSFAIINPRARNSVIRRVNEIMDSTPGNFLIDKTEFIKNILQGHGIKASAEYRIKTSYSIWRKMQNKAIAFNEINDIIGYRIVIENTTSAEQMLPIFDDNIGISCCYRALQVIHSVYKFIPNSFMDYISTPKQNGYKSLHTVVIDDRGVIMEFQIRTQNMHEEAELGLAAHWGYKTGTDALNSEDLQQKWIMKILEILNSSSTANDILEYTKLEMYKDKVFAFTKDGDIIHLPAKSKVLDFAFAVDFDKASRFIYAKVNGNIVHDLDTDVKNGDKIEIFTGKNPTLSHNWLKYVITGKAKHQITKMAKDVENYDKIASGMVILNKACDVSGVRLNQDTLNIILRHSGLSQTADLYLKCFNGSIDPMKLIAKVFNKMQTRGVRKAEVMQGVDFGKSSGKTECRRVSLGTFPNMICYVSKCCDIHKHSDIIGVLQSGSGIFLHNSACENLKQQIISTGIISAKGSEICGIDDISTMKLVQSNYCEDLARYLSENSEKYGIKILEYTVKYSNDSGGKTGFFALSGAELDLESFSLDLKNNFTNIETKILQVYEKI